MVPYMLCEVCGCKGNVFEETHQTFVQKRISDIKKEIGQIVEKEKDDNKFVQRREIRTTKCRKIFISVYGCCNFAAKSLTNLNDMDIIEEAFRMHRQQLVNYVNKRVDDYDLAEDIVQDAFVRLLGMEVGVREESIKPLLFTTCQHLIFDYLRRKKVAETVYQYMYTCESHAVETSEAILYAQELSTEEERVVSAMPWKRQQVYRLSRFEGQSIGEIAASMGVAHKTVEVHLFVGRKEVREQLRAYAS